MKKKMKDVANQLREKSSVFNPRATQLNNMSDEIPW